MKYNVIGFSQQKAMELRLDVKDLIILKHIIDFINSVEDFKEVILKKYNEWSGTIYAKYIRPSTLFKEGKFDEYLNQKRVDNNKEDKKENNNAAFCDFVID